MRGSKFADSNGLQTGTSIAKPLGPMQFMMRPKWHFALVIGSQGTFRGYLGGTYGAVQPDVWNNKQIGQLNVDSNTDGFVLYVGGGSQYPNITDIRVAISGFKPFVATWTTNWYAATVPDLFEFFDARIDKTVSVRLAKVA